MNILPLNGFFQFNMTGPILPSFYTNYYSQEDRLKAISKIISRSIEWNELTLEKVNELIDVVNDSNIPDVSSLVGTVNQLVIDTDENEADIAALSILVANQTSELTALKTRVSTVETELDNAENRLGLIDAAITLIEGKLTALTNRVTATEASIVLVNTKLVAINDKAFIKTSALTSAAEPSGASIKLSTGSEKIDGTTPTTTENKVTILSSDDSITVTTSGNTIDLKSVGGGGGETGDFVTQTEFDGFAISTNDSIGTLTDDVDSLKLVETVRSIETSLSQSGDDVIVETATTTGAGVSTSETSKSLQFTSSDGSVSFEASLNTEDLMEINVKSTSGGGGGGEVTPAEIEAINERIDADELRLDELESNDVTLSSRIDDVSDAVDTATTQLGELTTTVEDNNTALIDSIGTINTELNESFTSDVNLSVGDIEPQLILAKTNAALNNPTGGIEETETITFTSNDESVTITPGFNSIDFSAAGGGGGTGDVTQAQLQEVKDTIVMKRGYPLVLEDGLVVFNEFRSEIGDPEIGTAVQHPSFKLFGGDGIDIGVVVTDIDGAEITISAVDGGSSVEEWTEAASWAVDATTGLDSVSSSSYVSSLEQVDKVEIPKGITLTDDESSVLISSGYKLYTKEGSTGGLIRFYIEIDADFFTEFPPVGSYTATADIVITIKPVV